MYDRACARLGVEEAERRAAAGEPHVIRLRIPAGSTVVHDKVLGEVKFSHSVLDDQVLLKSDGFPTYHLASVVDDHAMDISHVIRGQEWLSSTPKHALTYAALGWEPPVYAHLPLLLNADRTKLSKRHGDAAVEDFMRAGYLPEALVNFVALLGWTPRDGREVMTLQDIVDSFSLDDINKANAVVDRARLNFFNGAHLRAMLTLPSTQSTPTTPAAPPAGFWRVRPELVRLLQAGLDDIGAAVKAEDIPAEVLAQLVDAQKDRVSQVSDFVALIIPYAIDGDAFATYMRRRLSDAPAVEKVFGVRKQTSDDAEALQSAVRQALQSLDPIFDEVADEWVRMSDEVFGAGESVKAVEAAAKRHGLKPAKALLPLRFLLTGLHVGTTMTSTLRLLGRARSIQRLQDRKVWA